MKRISRFFKKVFYDFVKFSGLPAMFLWFRPKYIFEDKTIQKRTIKGANVIICNHRKWTDSALIIIAFLRRRIRFLAASEKNNFWSWTLELVGGINIDRRKVDLDGIRGTIEIIKSGQVVTIFPEGKLVTEIGMKDFKGGTALIALRANVPIIPIYIEEPNSFWHRKKVVIGVPITSHLTLEPELISSVKIKELTEIMKEKMNELANVINNQKMNKNKKTVEADEVVENETRVIL